MSATVKLHPAERLLNELGRAERKRSGDLLTRQKAEFDIRSLLESSPHSPGG